MQGLYLNMCPFVLVWDRHAEHMARFQRREIGRGVERLVLLGYDAEGQSEEEVRTFLWADTVIHMVSVDMGLTGD